MDWSLYGSLGKISCTVSISKLQLPMSMQLVYNCNKAMPFYFVDIWNVLYENGSRGFHFIT